MKTIWIIVGTCILIYVSYRVYRFINLNEGLKEKVSKGAVVLDVRTPWEFETGHIDGAVNIPLSQLHADSIPLDKHKTYITVCSHGLRSVKATPPFTPLAALAAVLIALVFITIMSFVKEPTRQRINALIIAGAGATYWSGGLGFYEFPLGVIMIFLAYKGLKNYNFIAIGWLVHTVYDVLHHLYGHPIVPMSPLSSAGCAVCDPVLAIWFFLGAPSVFLLFRRPQVTGH